MDTEAEIKGLQDAAIHLANVLERRGGRFADDVDAIVVHEGRLFWDWAKEVLEARQS